MHSFLDIAPPAIRCTRCSGECESSIITLTLRRTSSEFAIFRNVPAEICQLCGETQFSMPTTVNLIASLQANHAPDDMAVVPIYDFRPTS